MNWDILSPNYAITIKTPEQARLYNKILMVKIAVQILVICGLLALGGVSWQMLAVIIGVATVWQAVSFWSRKRKLDGNKPA
jgi:hypothetical protein